MLALFFAYDHSSVQKMLASVLQGLSTALKCGIDRLVMIRDTVAAHRSGHVASVDA